MGAQLDLDDVAATSELAKQELAALRAEARAEALRDAADRAEMALAVMFAMGEITKSKAVSMLRAAIAQESDK